MNAGPDTTTDAVDAEALDSLLDALIDDGAASGGAPRGPIRFGRYTLHERIGEGGMGIVYRASRADLPGFIALKAVPALFATPTVVARMRREAEILGRLDIPGVVRIIESGIARTDLGEQPFIAMDLIDGEHIDRFVRRTNATPTDVIALVRSLCSIIEQAHRAGVVHRDLKPSNVLVDELGSVRVLDFGVAKADNALRTQLTRTGDRIGTPGYMSPEQRRGEPAGPSADVYAIACLTRGLLRSVESHAPGTPRQVDRAIEWGTRPRDEQRCPSPAAFSEAIAGNALPTGRSRRRTRNAAALIATALALGTTTLGTTRPVDHEPTPPRAAVLLSTDAALSDRERTNLDTEYAQIERIETITDGEITALSTSDEAGTMSRRLADALGLACWSRGMEGVAPVFFGAAFAAGEREGLDKTQPTWHRQVQLDAESRIRIGEHGTAIEILDAATSQVGTTAQHPTPVASNIRSAVLRLWWTRAWAMHKQGETEEARALLATILDAQHTGFPDHTDWLDSLDALTQILAERGQGAAGVTDRYAVPVGIADAAIHERWSRIAAAGAETGSAPTGR